MLGDERNAADTILAHRAELALEVRELFYASNPESYTYHQESVSAGSVESITFQLGSLASALRTQTTALFDDYVCWESDALARRGVPSAELERQLKCLEQVLIGSYPVYGGIIEAYVASARQRIGFNYPEPGTAVELGTLAAQYLALLLAGDRARAVNHIQEFVAQGASVQDAYLEIVEPAQQEVGRLWQANELTVAQEHFITAVSQLGVAQLYPSMMRNRRSGTTLLATSVAGELHELGARMVADFFEMDGWDTTYLGANTPVDALLEHMLRDVPDLLALSVTTSFQVSALAAVVEAVRANPALRTVGILVGGRPFKVCSDLSTRIGADAFATDARAAVQAGRALLAGRRAVTAERSSSR